MEPEDAAAAAAAAGSTSAFPNLPVSYDEGLLVPLTPKLKNHPLSTVHDCLFSILVATLHILLSAT
jgi:hypothetical protein